MTQDGNQGLKIYIGLFLVINVLIMVNLLIALMLQDYNALIKKSRPLYLQWLLQIQNMWAYDERLGCLTFKLGPLAVLNFLLFPWLFCGRCGKKLNRALQFLNYTLVFLILAPLYCALDILYHFKAIWSILTLSKYRRSRCRRFMKLIKIFFGFPIILLYDLFSFMKDAFSTTSPNRIEEDPHHQLIPLTTQEVELLLSVLCKIASKLLEKNRRLLRTRVVIKRLRARMFVSLKPADLLRNDTILDFTKLKHFLWRNSTYFNSEMVLDSLALHSALSNAYLQYKTQTILNSQRTKANHSDKYRETESDQVVTGAQNIISGGLIIPSDDSIANLDELERKDSPEQYWEE